MTTKTRPTPIEKTISLRFGKNAIDQHLLQYLSNRHEDSGHSISTGLKRLAYERLVGATSDNTNVFHAVGSVVSEDKHQGTLAKRVASSARKPFQKKLSEQAYSESNGEMPVAVSEHSLPGPVEVMDHQQTFTRQEQFTDQLKGDESETILLRQDEFVLDFQEDDGFGKDILTM